MIAGPQTGWKWHSFDTSVEVPGHSNHLTLLTLVFPASYADAPPSVTSSFALLPVNQSVVYLPTTSNPLKTYSQDRCLALSVQHSDAPGLMGALQEIPSNSPNQESLAAEAFEMERKTWVMKAAGAHTNNTIAQWINGILTDFLDIYKSAQSLDIVVMVLGYILMHLTFVSLFLSMKKLGSKVWLATSVLLSSTFAFLLGLDVTMRLGIPINMRLLSEGLPFLVVIIGFEKSITLTKSVISHAVKPPKPQKTTGSSASGDASAESTIQYAVRSAIQDKGYNIACYYAVEILLLVVGAASGVQGGLRHFCFLAALILFFDCLLLFTFYTAILSIKLDVNRIKPYFDTRHAFEEDGLSR